MRFFNRQKKSDAWLALFPQRDAILAASVVRRPGARPAVKLAAAFAGALDAALLDKVAKETQAAGYRCTTVLASGDYQMITVESPNVAREELKPALRWKLKDVLDFPVDDATFDVLDIPVDGATGRAHSVFAVAARNAIVKARQQLFTDAKLPLEAIDIPEMAQRNMAALVEPEGRGVAMLAFGEDGGLLTVTWRGELYLARRIDVTLAQLLDEDHDRKHASFDKIALQLQRTLDGFERQFSFINVAKLVLAPSGATGFDEYLSSNLYTKVETLDLASVFDLAAAPQLAGAAAQQRFFVTLGAALRGEAA
jgi:MSHA biogenesis protein MshI